MMGAGEPVLILSYFFHSSDYDIIFDIVNISGTLFVWEGANTAFIQRNFELRNAKSLQKRCKILWFCLIIKNPF